VWGMWCRVRGIEFRVQSIGLLGLGLGLRESSGYGVLGFWGLGVWGLGCEGLTDRQVRWIPPWARRGVRCTR